MTPHDCTTDSRTDTDSLLLRESTTVQPDVHIDRETWRSIVALAEHQLTHDPGADPVTAYWDAVHQFVETSPNLVVDGELKGPADVPAISADDLPDGDEQSDGESERVELWARAEYRPNAEVPLQIRLDPPEHVLEDVGGWKWLTESARIVRVTDSDE